MAQMSVAQFATELKMDPVRLLEQLQSAGVIKKLADDTLTEQDKTRLLDYLHRVHGGGEARKKITVTRKKDYPKVSFDGSSERWAVLGAGLFEGKVRGVVSTLGPRSRGVTTDKVVIKPGQMKLFYVLDGTVTLHCNGDRHRLETGDSALLDGSTSHGWENLGDKPARALWVILG